MIESAEHAPFSRRPLGEAQRRYGRFGQYLQVPSARPHGPARAGVL
jgi:hypothetical protein